jgi:succinate dehydrogenase / fumarate reductase membrane anchor subunit
MSSLRSPLSEARGLGSSHHGVSHWWMQRLTAMALAPLSLWFVGSMVYFAGADYATFTAWIGSPAVAISLIIFVFCIFYHSQLGLQVIIEDYIHAQFAKFSLLVLMKFVHVIAAVAAIFSILRIAYGAG